MISVEQILRGTDLYPHIRIRISEYYIGHLHEHHRLMAKENKMRLSDWLILGSTKEIPNTKIARKLLRDRIIKPYSEDTKYIRIMK